MVGQFEACYYLLVGQFEACYYLLDRCKCMFMFSLTVEKSRSMLSSQPEYCYVNIYPLDDVDCYSLSSILDDNS